MTIRQNAVVAGIGIHTGAACRATLAPAAPGTGVVFQVPGGQRIPARAQNVVDTTRCTVLGAGEGRISTVEHLLSACAGLGIADLRVEVDGPELPIGDGSAAPWVDALRAAGASGSLQTRALDAPVEVFGRGGAFVAAYPAPRLSVTVGVHFDHPVVGTQLARFVEGDDYAGEIADARTFGFRDEVDRLLAAGLARGGSLDNAVVVEATGYSVSLRHDNELARHKLLDLLGDLFLAGPLPCAEVVAVRPSHALNNQMARALAATRS